MPIVYEVSAGVGVIVIDRPEVLNAFDDALGKEMLRVTRAAIADESARCIVITGAGRAFCSGEDLGALSGGYERGEVAPLGKTLTDRYNPLIRAIRSAPKPVIAAVNGVAAGAGASLALACDLRIASEHAKLVLAFIKVGLVPDSGAVWLLARAIGEARALELAISGRQVKAEEALQLGLVTEVVAADAFEDRWRTVARGYADGPTRAFALTKRLVASTSDLTLDEQLDIEVEAQTEAGLTEDHLEGVKAFLEKRPASFQGR